MFIIDWNIRQSKIRQQGLSLIELVIFIVVVGIAVVGILGVLALTTSRSADPQLRKQALSIAEALLEEVQSARFTFCDPGDANAATATGAFVGGAGCQATVENVGPEPGNTIRPFDNVNDYVANFASAQSYTVDAAGTAFPSGYAATVQLTPEALSGIASDAAPATMNALRITVTVAYGNDSVMLEGYRTRYAPTSLP